MDTLESKRDQAVRRLTAAYAVDAFDLPELERRLAVVIAAQAAAEIEGVVADIPAVVETAPAVADPSFPEPHQVLRGSMQTLRREGFWLRSRHVVVTQHMSSVRLDLSQIAGHDGEIFEMELALEMSSCRILVPLGTRVEDDLELHASSFRARRRVRREERETGPRLVLRGKAAMSSVVVVPSRRR